MELEDTNRRLAEIGDLPPPSDTKLANECESDGIYYVDEVPYCVLSILRNINVDIRSKSFIINNGSPLIRPPLGNGIFGLITGMHGSS